MNTEIEKELQKCLLQLKANGIAVIPSETGWSIVTDFLNTNTIETLMDNEKYLFPVILLKEPGQLMKYFDPIPDAIFNMIEFSNRPIQIQADRILNHPVKEHALINLPGFMVPKDEFTHQLLFKHGKPLFSVTKSDNSRELIDAKSLTENCYVVNLRQSPKYNPDALIILKFYSDGRFEFLKK